MIISNHGFKSLDYLIEHYTMMNSDRSIIGSIRYVLIYRFQVVLDLIKHQKPSKYDLMIIQYIKDNPNNIDIYYGSEPILNAYKDRNKKGYS